MKVKCISLKFEDSGFTEGKSYRVMNVMASMNGGLWCEVETDIDDLYALISTGRISDSAYGKFEIESL